MILKFGVALATFALLATSAFAADIADPSACTVSGIVQGGGLMDRQAVDFGGGAPPNTEWKSAFGEAALNYSCANWGAQIDAAGYGLWADNPYGDNDLDLTVKQGHVGGAMFRRDASVATFGFSGSRIFQSFATRKDIGYNQTTALWRGGAFAEFYPSDMFTLGAGAFYLNGKENYQLDGNIHGFEGDVYLKLYATDNIALTLRGDLLNSHVENATRSFDYTGNVFSAEAEYLVPNTALSVFVGGRMAHRQFYNDIKFDDTQGFVGAKFAFGGGAPASLRERDRNGTFDNTSVFHEKLPGLKTELTYD